MVGASHAVAVPGPFGQARTRVIACVLDGIGSAVGPGNEYVPRRIFESYQLSCDEPRARDLTYDLQCRKPPLSWRIVLCCTASASVTRRTRSTGLSSSRSL